MSLSPLPLSQGVLLSLLQQLACDINNDTPRKLEWMTAVAAAILPTAVTGAELASIRVLMHVINYLLVTCKR